VSDLRPLEVRLAHPYITYDEIKAQPDAVERAIDLALDGGAPVVAAVARARHVFIAGTGASLRAARAGAWMLRTFSRGKIDATAVESFTFATYTLGLRPDDLLIAVSIEGATPSTVRAVDRASRSGMETVLLVGDMSKAISPVGHVLSTGFSAGRSLTGTASYTAAMASFAALGNDLADPAERLDLRPLPEAVRESLESEGIVHRLAATYTLATRAQGGTNAVFTGGGPNEVTAYAAQSSVMEMSHLPAGAVDIETALHGSLAAMNEHTLLVVIAPPGPAAERAMNLTRAASLLDMTPVVLVSEDNVDEFGDCHRVLLPTGVPEHLTPITSIVPLQLFAYYLALGQGVNPDLLRSDDPRYLEAYRSIS
jgi:glucosamine 6-phosphate synthetase-like amidotransferase/phosphosugar isomerase protein